MTTWINILSHWAGGGMLVLTNSSRQRRSICRFQLIPLLTALCILKVKIHYGKSASSLRSMSE